MSTQPIKHKNHSTMKNEKHLIAVAKWTTKHEKTLRSLYRDFQKDQNDSDTPFEAFALFMYNQCKH